MSADSDDTTERTLGLKARFDADGTPERVKYYSPTYGMMKFHVEDGVAVLDEKFNRLTDKHLKDGCTRPTAGDVVRSVEQLGFIDDVEVRERAQ
jgi:hypothetical protein